MKQLFFIIALMLSSISMGAQTKNNEMKYNKIQVEDCRVFYREAGNPENPTLLLLHGFPSSSHMFRELMPELADEYHLIAPDFPAFGQTESPDREHFTYIPAGANAFKRDLPNAEIHFVPSGHFALESHHTKIAQLMREFLVGVVQ